MTPLSDMLQQGGTASLLFIPSAIVIGALHGLEPGHSKTMMAAFIVAVRGTVSQAVLLGLAATVSHTAVVWAIALGGLYFFSGLDAEATEPYFQVASAGLIIAIAVWMLLRTWREQHAFTATTTFDDHQHHHHHHDHDHDLNVAVTGEEPAAMDDAGAEPMDAHSRAHANAIKQRFDGRRVTTGQIVMFGLTGGLVPCPAAITVLLLCIQVKQMVTGSLLVLAFSVGLALTMVSVGVAAALSVTHLSRRFTGFGRLAARAPYVSSVVIIAMGLYLGYEGLHALTAGAI